MANVLFTGFGQCDQSPGSCAGFDDLVQQMGRPSGLDPAIPFNILAGQHTDIVPQSMRLEADGFLHHDAQAQATGALNQCLDQTQNAIQPDRAALKQESDPQLSIGLPAVVRGADPPASKIQADDLRLHRRAAQIEVTLKAVDFSTQLIRLVNPKLANQGSADLFNQNAGAQQSRTVSGPPTDGRTVYVRLWSLTSNSLWRDYNYNQSH